MYSKPEDIYIPLDSTKAIQFSRGNYELGVYHDFFSEIADHIGYSQNIDCYGVKTVHGWVAIDSGDYIILTPDGLHVMTVEDFIELEERQKRGEKPEDREKCNIIVLGTFEKKPGADWIITDRFKALSPKDIAAPPTITRMKDGVRMEYNIVVRLDTYTYIAKRVK